MRLVTKTINMRSAILLTTLALFSFAAAVPQIAGISTRSYTITIDPSATYSRLPAETQVEKMCQPRMEVGEYGTDEEVRAAGLDAYASFEDIWKDSPFPCELLLGGILYMRPLRQRPTKRKRSSHLRRHRGGARVSVRRNTGSYTKLVRCAKVSTGMDQSMRKVP